MTAASDYASLTARVRAARSSLVSDQTFLRLAALPDARAVLALLADTPYASELSGLSGSSSPSEFDSAVGTHLKRAFRSLRRWAAGEAARTLPTVLARGDVQDLKAILRGAWGEVSADEVRLAISGLGNLPDQAWEDMLVRPGVEGRLAVLDRWLPSWSAKLRETARQPGHGLADLEDALDRVYFRQLIDVDGYAPWDSRKVLATFGRRLLILDDRRTRLRLEGEPEDEGGGGRGRAAVERELDLEEFRIARSLYLAPALTLGPAVGWIWEKLREARLIRLILRGKREGLLPEVLAAEVTGG